MFPLLIEEHLKHFFKEDVQFADLSADLIFNKEDKGTAIILAKEDGIFSGSDIISAGFILLDKDIEIKMHVKDGETICRGQIIAELFGQTRALLTGERTILNIIQRMSGIASLTKEAIRRLNNEAIRVCDTRKTMPGLRLFDKYAVLSGGGYNHRQSLNDAIMIKDNHIDYCGSITEAVRRAKQAGPTVKIEVETENEAEVIEAVEAEVDLIMFDNRSPEEINHFQKHVPHTILTEASGGIHLDNIHLYKETMVDYISLGCLTQDVKSLDFSMLVDGGKKR